MIVNIAVNYVGLIVIGYRGEVNERRQADFRQAAKPGQAEDVLKM